MSERRVETTKEMLVRELRAAGIHYGIVGRAQSGQFSDFESEHPAPKTLLVMLLQSRAERTTVRERRRLLKFAKRVIAGEFDDTKEEAAAWMAKEGWAELEASGTRVMGR